MSSVVTQQLKYRRFVAFANRDFWFSDLDIMGIERRDILQINNKWAVDSQKAFSC